MVLKHRDKISLQEDGQNITDLRETEFFNISQCNGPFAAELSHSKSPGWWANDELVHVKQTK